jgi:hypothetical protein
MKKKQERKTSRKVKRKSSPSSGFVEQFAEPASCNIAIDFAAGHVEHESLPLLAIWFRFDSVKPQEHDRSHHRRSFIPIDKRMVFADVEQVSSCDFYDVGIGRFATKAGLWRKDCRRQQVFVTHAVCAAELFDYFEVNLANDVDAEMDAIVRRGVVSRHFPATLDR